MVLASPQAAGEAQLFYSPLRVLTSHGSVGQTSCHRHSTELMALKSMRWRYSHLILQVKIVRLTPGVSMADVTWVESDGVRI